MEVPTGHRLEIVKGYQRFLSTLPKPKKDKKKARL